MEDKEHIITVKDLPLIFNVKYLGHYPSKGLWGMKHTRKPVDALVSLAKKLPADSMIPLVRIEISTEGFAFKQITTTTINNKNEPTTIMNFPIDTISYGVQDLIYTRVFSMIIVTNENIENGTPFICHSFVCESRNQARHITYALAAAFQDYGRRAKLELPKKKRFAIDLRTPEEQTSVSDEETEA